MPQNTLKAENGVIDFRTDPSENVYPMMMSGKGQTEMLLSDLTKGREAGPFDRAVDNAVLRLRKKLGEDGPRLIRTVHGAGYSFAADVERA